MKKKEYEEQERQTDHIFTVDYQPYPDRGDSGGKLDYRHSCQEHCYR